MQLDIILQFSNFILTQAADSPAAENGGGFGGLVGMAPLLLMFLVIYFLLIRPASKQRREHQALLNALKKNDEIVTSGGIYGRIIAIDEKIVTLEITEKVKIKILRDRIAGKWIVPKPQK